MGFKCLAILSILLLTGCGTVTVHAVFDYPEKAVAKKK